MISLRSTFSPDPLQPGDDLIGHLAASPRPAIIHYTADGRTELSGRVAINWATKTTHLIDSYGVASPATMLLDVPVTWRSVAVTLGVAWCDLTWVDDADEADAILTDRPEDYEMAAAEIFVTHRQDVDPSMTDLDDEVLSHADQALLASPDVIGNALREEPTPAQAQRHSAGVIIHATGTRLTPGLWSVMVDAWRRSTPVVLIDQEVADQLERIVASEHLGTAIAG